MKSSDLFRLAFGNLWRMKLRSTLTIIGVVIAIATFTAMLSFGVGMQTNFRREFEKLGLLTKIQVFPHTRGGNANDPDSQLNDETVEQLRQLPGVVAAFPFESFNVTLEHGDSTVNLDAQGISTRFLSNGTIRDYLAGGTLSSDSAREAILLKSLVEELGYSAVDSIVGKRVVISRRASSLDSAFARLRMTIPPPLMIASSLNADSIFSQGYLQRFAKSLFLKMASEFSKGYFENKGLLSDTLTVAGVLADQQVHALRLQQLLLPPRIASPYATSAALDDPLTLFASAREGELPIPGEGLERVNAYSRVTLEVEPFLSHDAIVDSVHAMGFGAFSYEQQFKNMRVFFAVFNTGLGGIGFVAMVIAALGIVNTMVMSILERYREIGVLKSLGADDSDIHRIFLVESAFIGLAGSLIGVLTGWLITRAAMVVVKHLPTMENMPFVDLFALPVWLIFAATVFGVLISLVAGLYPAARASRVDPVVALRND